MSDYNFRGGIAILFAIPKDRAFNDNGSFDTQSLKTDEAIRFPLYHGQNYQFKEETQETSQGTLYKISIQGSFPSAMMGRSDVRTLREDRFCVVAIDTMGNAKIAGTADVPLKCNVVHDTGNDCPATNSVAFEFYGTESLPATSRSYNDIL